MLLGGGCDIACVAQQLGHSPAVLLSTYTVLFLRLRGKDSNLDYLIQSQASYH